MAVPLVELRHVSKSFGSVYALRDINLALHEKEIVSLLGDNGAGKSTLTKIISGVHSPDEGELYIKGKKVVHWNAARARLMGIETVYQDKALAEHQNVTRNIFMGREITTWLGFINGRRQRQQAEALMRRIGFTSKVMSPNSVVSSLSGGEREGVAIARSMFFKADLIILDEPTTALSLTQSQEVLQFVERARKEGSAVLFISHNIFHSHQVADRIVIVDRGRIAAQMDKEGISAIELTELMQDLAKGKEVLARKGGAIDDISLEETNEAPLSQTDRRSPA
jgi:simple sugar transport system ATP-binding protein